jgi:hypothetical protein
VTAAGPTVLEAIEARRAGLAGASEARIPLVIAGAVDEPRGDLERLADLARRLEPGADFATDEHARNVFLTDRGVRRAERELGCGDLFTADSARLQAELRNALHAETLLRRDVDYIVRDGRVELIAELGERIDDEVVAAFERLEITADGIDWRAVGLRGPSSTWTYLVDDNVFAGNTFLGLANRPAIGLWGVLLLWPVLLVWGLAQHWRRRREPRDED